MSGSNHGEDEDMEDHEMSQDRAFIDHDVFSQHSSQGGFRGPDDARFEREGSRVSYHAEQGSQKRVRLMPRQLQTLYPLGLYCDYSLIFPWAKYIPRISHFVSPYALYSSLDEPRYTSELQVSCNDFIDKHAVWLGNEAVQLDFARRFASYTAYTTSAQAEPLRPLSRMVPVDDKDVMHTTHISPVAEVIAAHNVLNERDELDTQPCPDVSHEFVCKGDFVTESKLRDCPVGGLPGLPSVDLFMFEEAVSSVEVANGILRLLKYWNFGASRPELLPGNTPYIQTEMADFYKNSKSNAKYTRVSVSSFSRERHLDEKAILQHVHPDISKQFEDPTVPTCRASPVVETKTKDDDKNSLFSSQLIVVPNRVRDSTGKIRHVVCSILRIRSKAPGCDPVIALRALLSMQGFDVELLNVVQHMVRLLELPCKVSTDSLFDATNRSDSANLASIGHEANLLLAFFQFLKMKRISSAEPSPFAADWMGQRIDVYDKEEVVLYKHYMQIAHESRNKYYAYIVKHTNHDMQNARNAHLELPTTTVDWRLFFPGHHYRAIPRGAMSEVIDAAMISSTDRQSFDAFLDSNPDSTYVFWLCDRAPNTRGYVCEMQTTLRADENAESIKLQQQRIYKEGQLMQEELQCLHYCSKRFELYSTFIFAPRDPYEAFLERTAPYPTIQSLRENINGMTSIERQYYAYLTNPPDRNTHMQREKTKTSLVRTVYGLSDNPVHSELELLHASSDIRVLLPHVLETIANAVSKHLHVCANAPVPQLKYAARFILDLKHVDENPPRTDDTGTSIAHQHLDVHRRVNLGVLNDDTKAGRIEVQQFDDFKSELNTVNYAVLRWLLLGHLAVWSNTRDGSYGYCIQICDMGSSARVRMENPLTREEKFIEWDKKMPGSGADTVWNMFGEYVNAFPKFLGRTEPLRDFFASNNFCELYQQKSLMSIKRQNGVVTNVNDCVLDNMSEHTQNMGVVGAMLELNKLEQDKTKQCAIWPNLESGLGQSGSTGRGVKEKPYTTTISGVVVNIMTVNPLQIILLASNLLSVERPVSVNDGSRVVPVTSGCSDDLGRITDGPALLLVQPRVNRPKTLANFTDDKPNTSDVRRVDRVVAKQNMSMFLMEYMARAFALIHRGLCLKRETTSGFGMFLWADTRNNCMHITTNIRKTTYAPDDIMARNFNGAFETAVFGKWVRSVIQTALHNRLMRTVQTAEDECKTQLQSILIDAVTTFMLAPCSTAVLLSAMQLYLTLVLLDVSVMLVSCMILYYLQLSCNCPLHILALVARGREADLSSEEKQLYYNFAAFLHAKLVASIVPVACMHTELSPDNTCKLFGGNIDGASLDADIAASPPSVYICSKFFDVPKNLLRPDRQATTAKMCAKVFAESQKTGTEPEATVFWANAGPATRIPIPHDRSNDRSHGKFDALNECPHLYNDVIDKLNANGKRTSLGILVGFLRVCDLPSQVSRLDLVATLLRPWADSLDICLQPLHNALQRGGAWTTPILKYKNKIEGKMIDWAVNGSFDNVWNYNGRIGLAVDVLWFILSQALFAGEWQSSPTDRLSVVHTRNMSGAAQAVLFLYLHMNIPKAAIPACSDGGVVLSEPSHVPGRNGEAIVIPYVSGLHVDSYADGAMGTGFLNAAMRERRNGLIVRTQEGPLLLFDNLQLLDRTAKNIGADVLARGDVCTFPPEAVAHMLPSMPGLMRAFRRLHQQYPDFTKSAGSAWVVAMRLFGSGADAHTLGFLPVALTQHALDEDIPCFTYKHGFCFMLRVVGQRVRLTPVDVQCTLDYGVADEGLEAHSTFERLPLSNEFLSFPADELKHAMTGGLVLHDNVVAYTPPAIVRDSQEPMGEPVAFTFMPIIRFQCLLLLEIDLVPLLLE
jgi:hypothetical protein